MTASRLAGQIVRGAIAPGIYRMPTRVRPAPLADTLSAAGWRVFVIDGKMITDKASFLRGAAEAMAFPAYAGHNWDAFEELVNDLSWTPAKGYVLVYDTTYPFAAAQPAAWQTARAILQDAVAAWERLHVPLFVLLRKNWHWNRDIPALDDAPEGANP